MSNVEAFGAGGPSLGDTIIANEKPVAAAKRLASSNLQGYHQIIAVSQDSINSILAARFNIHMIRQKDKRLRTFKHAIADEGSIDAEMLAPTVEMSVAGDPQSVYFFVNFKAGTFKYPKLRGMKVTIAEHKVDGWSIAFTTKLNLNQVEKLPKDIRDKIALTPGSYSALRLVAAFSAGAAAQINWDRSTLTGLEAEAEKTVKEVQQKFHAFMDLYDLWLKSSTVSVLGYALKLDDHAANPSPTQTTFVPTSLITTTQEYVPQTETFKQGFPKRNGYDAIVFEEMTGQEPPPAVPYNTSTAGNWIVGGIQASLAMSNSLFFKRFLLPKLELINARCLDLAQHVHSCILADNWKLKPEDTTKRWDIGYDQPRPTSTPFNVVDDVAHYEWSGGNWGKEPDSNGGHIWYKTAVTNRIQLSKLQNSITVTASTEHEVEWTGARIPNYTPNSISMTSTVKMPYPMSISLSTVKDGKLEMNVAANYPANNDKDHPEGNAMIGVFENMLTNSSVIKEVQNAISGSSGFVFPGAGDFFMKNPTFNHAGDLLLELEYKVKEIAIDEVFQLQVWVPTGNTNMSSYNRKWLKVQDPSKDHSDTILVDQQADATNFEIDDGKLTVYMGDAEDEHGRAVVLPAGANAVAILADDSSNTKAKTLQFVTASTFAKLFPAKHDGDDDDDDDDDSKDDGKAVLPKLEFGTAGRYFDFYTLRYHDPAGPGAKTPTWLWMDQFCLDASKTKAQCWVADPDGASDLFSLTPVF